MTSKKWDQIKQKHEIRIQSLGSDKYVSEFWEDKLVTYSDANIPKEVPNIEAAKRRYAETRKGIEDGKEERFFKVMAVLYIKGHDGTVNFQDPFEPVYALIKK